MLPGFGMLAPVEMPRSTEREMADVNLNLFGDVNKWLKKHGKGVKLRLTDAQKEELQAVFRMMDSDNGGSIDVGELSAAFKLLGFKLSRTEIAEIVSEVDHDGSGELEFQEFLEVMTLTLLRISERKEQEATSQVPMSLITTAYKRKKLLEGLFECTQASLAEVAAEGREQELAAAAAAARAEEAAKKALAADTSQPSQTLWRTAARAQLSPTLLSGLGTDELAVLSRLLNTTDADFHAHAGTPLAVMRQSSGGLSPVAPRRRPQHRASLGSAVPLSQPLPRGMGGGGGAGPGSRGSLNGGASVASLSRTRAAAAGVAAAAAAGWGPWHRAAGASAAAAAL
ncbi:hypothetical protein FOA52_003921 [Chlamydomonas sp. UWO 241]|nr:hypothetical protein FOA52_003921 [Chlamydomonas sp. UWO 241]